jgi:putative ABC transport system permease protein
MIDVARKLLLHDKLRFAITVSGVAFAVSLVFIQVGLFLGLLDNASVTIDKANADLWVTSRNTANIDYGQAFPANYVQRVRSVPGVERADNLIVWFVRLNLPSGSTELVITYAMEDFSRWNLPWNVSEGNVQDMRRGNYVFVDESAAKRYGPFSVGDYREFLGRRMKIIGKTKEVVSFTTTPIAFMDFHVAQTLDPLNLADRTIYTLVKLEPGANVERIRAEIQRRLPYNDVHTKAQWASNSRKYWVKTTGIGLNMYLTVFLGCLVGIVVVAQTLYTSTMEHYKEFATVKAIGGSNMDVYRILAKQAVVAAVVGFIFGAGTGPAMQPLMAKMGLKLIIPNEFFGYVFGGTVLLCLLASLISYRKIASADPALVFRT